MLRETVPLRERVGVPVPLRDTVGLAVRDVVEEDKEQRDAVWLTVAQ